MKLNELKPKEGSVHTFKAVGRGIGSGKGKTCGRGVKGQKARTGKTDVRSFEGGQTPLYRRIPKRGFNNIFARDLVEITLERLQEAIDSKRLDSKGAIDEDTLVKSGVIRNKRCGVRLIGTGALKAKVELKISGGATKSAIAAIEKAGGKVEIVEPAKRVAKEGKEKAAPKAKKAPAKKAKKAE